MDRERGWILLWIDLSNIVPRLRSLIIDDSTKKSVSRPCNDRPYLYIPIICIYIYRIMVDIDTMVGRDIYPSVIVNLLG